VENLLDEVVPNLKQLFVENKNEYTRGKFYDLMVNLYDRYTKYRQYDAVKGSLIHGLNDKSKTIRHKIAGFWGDQNRLKLDPFDRLQQLMDVMYASDEENLWLSNSAYLILQVSTQSPDYNRKIFDQPLQECQFAPLQLNYFG
jgi:DNA-dependent protein kinase catalytic subunit